MTIAVIGTGFIGDTLGHAFARAGHETIFGTRRPTGEPDTTTIADAIAKADVVLLAVPAAAMAELLGTHGAALAGKLVIDAANNVGAPVAHHADLVARHAPGARYARAFNTLGGENFADPDFGGIPADLFYSAPAQDRATLDTLITAVGLRPVYVGADKQDIVDGVLRLWFALAVGQGRGRHLAFHTLTR